jgi:hypothetical protein
VCVFPDGSECEAWTYYRKCNSPEICSDCNCPWPCPTRIIYVDDDAEGANDGTSWENAYKYLQDALADANSARKPVEIRVAQGIYKPDQGKNQTPGDREATFHLVNGVALKCSYAGLSEPDPNARDIHLYETLLSGDLHGDDSRTWPSNRDENSCHVVTGSGTNTTVALDGFTITAGNAVDSILGEEAPYDFNVVSGAGIYNVSGSPELVNCTFAANRAYFGGGMFNSGSSPTLISCTFSENAAMGGGGMFNKNSSPSLLNCTFSKNGAPLSGGGMHNYNSSPSLINCTFSRNSAFMTGGISNVESCPTLVNCTFSGNLALIKGGGAIRSYKSTPTLTNCTFVGNLARLGGNSFDCSSNGGQDDRSNVKIVNCILWDGGPEISNNDGSTITIGYTNVRGGQSAISDPCNAVIWGQGNVDADPCFADPGCWEDPCNTPNEAGDDVWIDGDYHLKSQAGRWDAKTQRWIKDDVTSPCIDAGDRMSPIAYEPFPNGGRINMGAYSGTAEASKSYFGEPVCETIVAGDINGDCKVDFADFAIMALHWLEDNNF